MIKYSIQFVFFLMICLSANGQGLIEYNFNGCSLMEETGLHDDLLSANLNCDCGVVQGEDSYLLNGIDDFLEFPLSVNAQLVDDFTMSFYFQMENQNQDVDILSLKRVCTNLDSSLTIKYNALTETVDVEMAESFAKLVELKGSLNLNQCWHHFVLGRRGTEYFLYLDDVLVDSELASGAIALADSTTMKISNGNCAEARLMGRIDEFRIYNTFLEGLSLSALDLGLDKILNPDTTVFLGDGVQIVSGQTCSNGFTWSPTNGINNVSIVDPFITPTESTSYSISFDYGFCTSIDTIRIFVLDPNALDCENLLLPKAFTPNGDGLNDLYGISNDFIIEELESFEIFDRWGEKMFTTTDKQVFWDGTFKNTVLNPGMFVYKINYTCVGEKYSKVGNFSILR